MAREALDFSFTLEDRLPELRTLSERSIRRKVYAMGTTVREKLLTEVLIGNRSGQWYRVPGTKRTYRASLPGEAPATRLGDLRRSYRVGNVEGSGLNANVKVGSNLKYAPVLEAEDALNRPHLSTAGELAKSDIEEILRGDWGI